jgi:hypothetical protein
MPIRDLATDQRKREPFTRLAEHLSILASEVEAAMASQLGSEETNDATSYVVDRCQSARREAAIGEMEKGGAAFTLSQSATSLPSRT